MDRALDDIIAEKPRNNRPRGGRGGGAPTGPRDSRRPPPRNYDSGPRDGIRKQYSKEPPRNLDQDWVHDKWDEDGRTESYGRRRDPYPRDEPASDRRRPQSDAKLRVSNIHWELLEPDLRELFSRIGPLESVQLLYDRADRPTGTAFVTYHHLRDAEDAVREFDGANAYGQPIRVTLLPPPADRDARPGRSLFDRIDSNTPAEPRQRRPRSTSPPRKGEIDRYVPPGSRRSPVPRRGTPRGGGGRRPGERASGPRGGPGRSDTNSKPRSGARPRKTAEELDAEMNDYWKGAGDQDKPTENGDAGKSAAAALAEDVDIMVE